MPVRRTGTLTTAELESAFCDYFEEIDRCLAGQCYWALVHILVVLPDICAALQHEDGKTTGPRYQEWCRRHLDSRFRSPLDHWEIRCKVLHQGRTLPTRGTHRSYSFHLPNQPVVLHDVVTSPDQNISVDIGALVVEMRDGVRAWFAWLQKPENATFHRAVAANIGSLARMKQKTSRGIAGVEFKVWSSTST